MLLVYHAERSTSLLSQVHYGCWLVIGYYLVNYRWVPCIGRIEFQVILTCKLSVCFYASMHASYRHQGIRLYRANELSCYEVIYKHNLIVAELTQVKC